MNEYRIDNDVPLPDDIRSRWGSSAAATLARANIGDSVFVPDIDSRISSRFCVYGSGWFTARTLDGGVRVWKIAEPPKGHASSLPRTSAAPDPDIPADRVRAAVIAILAELATSLTRGV